MAVIRAFIAIDLSPEIISGLESTLLDFKRKMAGLPVKWVPVNNIHLTLKFLGDVPASNLESLKGMLRSQASSRRSFEFQVGQRGAFPSTRRPRVIWIGVQAPPDLLDIQKAIEVEAAHLGYSPEERGFSPHLTLGRVARSANNDDLRKIGAAIEASVVETLGMALVRSVNLYQSDLRPGGAVYTCLFSALLG